MQRSSYPAGETTTSRIKSLVLYLEQTEGRAAADALLSKVKLSREDIEDETRAIGVALWHVAAEEFAARFGAERLLDTWPGVLATKNLGVWIRVLRGAENLFDALSQLDGLGGDEVRTSRWETLEERPGFWRGRVFLSHDPRFERDGLLTSARAAELRALPVMFGYAPGEVEAVASIRGTLATRTGAAGQEFVLRYEAKAPKYHLPVGIVAGATVGTAGFGHSLVAGALASAVGAGLGAVGAVLLRRERIRRSDAKAQEYRIRALERSMLLSDNKVQVASGYTEGTVIAGMYRLEEMMGSGASGVIHSARRLSDNSPVAIKILRAAVAHDAVASDRLRREAEAMGLAWHPNVVELYDQGVLPDGTTYLVMEKLEGRSLATRLQDDGPVEPGELLPLALELCDALGAVHAAGVIHRDVKPSNIYLATYAKKGVTKTRLKILDFGIARVEWAETRLTNFGAPVGTPGYMSPEQQQGHEVDARSDLYSFGALLFECLTGEPPPLRRDSVLPLMPGEVPESGIHRSAPLLPAGWRELIEKATSHYPRDRFPDSKAMREAILGAARVSTPELLEKISLPPGLASIQPRG